MAYGVRQLSPLDLKPSTAIGVAIPFSADNVFTSVYTTKEQVKYNLINFLLTDRRERPFNPTFGAGLRSYIFEQLETQTLDDIEASISSKLEINFPNIRVTKLEVIGDTGNNSIIINFSYVLINRNESDNVIIKLQNS